MRDLVKRISAFVASVAFTAAMSFTVSAANITAQYNKETDNGKATLSGVKLQEGHRLWLFFRRIPVLLHSTKSYG